MSKFLLFLLIPLMFGCSNLNILNAPVAEPMLSSNVEVNQASNLTQDSSNLLVHGQEQVSQASAIKVSNNNLQASKDASRRPFTTAESPADKSHSVHTTSKPSQQQQIADKLDKHTNKQTLIEQYWPLSKFENDLSAKDHDYSDYGFVTPTGSLEGLVNEELASIRPEKLAHAKDLWVRLRKGFKLDLELDNKRIAAQLNWYKRNPDYLNRTFSRASYYLHHIVNEIEKRGLPMELALLPLVESAFDPFAYSHGRASGLWQFIPGTGKMYGLHQNWWYDGRRDVIASTKAALDYLSYLNKRFDGDWLHALASYNSGSGRVGKAIKKNRKKGRKTDFWSLKLPRETKAYVPKLLAIAKLAANPSAYGITLKPIPDEAYFKVVPLDSQIDLAQAASMANIEIKELYKLNPGFNQWATAPLGPHRLLIPIQNAAKFTQKLKVLPANKRITWNRYAVRSGDSLIKIAKKFHTTPALIKQVNRLRSNTIKIKQKLLIPVASKGKKYYGLSEQNRLSSKQSKVKGSPGSQKIVHRVVSGDTIWELAKKHKVSMRKIAKWNGMAPKDVLKPGKDLLIWSRANLSKTLNEAESSYPTLTNNRQMIKRIGYRVKNGDSLARIASKFNVSISQLLKWNKLNKKKYLQPGQKLTIYVDITRT